MSKISMRLLRTVFLPVGSPPIGSVCEIRADIGKADIHAEGEQLYCLGELDIIIDYLSFSANSGRRLFADKAADAYPGGEGREWQAMINLPFTLNEKMIIDGSCEYTTSLGEIKWFMVAPRALEMEMELILTAKSSSSQCAVDHDMNSNFADKNPEKDGGWQMVSINEQEQDMLQPGDDSKHREDISLHPEQLIGQQAGEECAEANGMTANDSQTAEQTTENAVAVTAVEVDEAAAAMPTPKEAPEIVRIVFNEEKMPSEQEIEAAVAKAQNEAQKAVQAPEIAAENEIAAMADKEIAEAALPTVAAEIIPPEETVAPKKARHIHGLPKLLVDAKNNNIEFTAFNINIKLP